MKFSSATIYTLILPFKKKKSIEALLKNESQALAKKKKIDSEVTEEDSTVTEREVLGASLFHAYTPNLPQLRNDCKGQGQCLLFPLYSD